MLKSLLFAIWASISSLGFFYLMTYPNSEALDHNGIGRSLTEHRTESIAIAVYRNNRVFGHFVARVGYSIPFRKTLETPQPVSLLIEDGLQDLLPNVIIEELASQEKEALNKLGRELSDLLNSRDPDLSIEKLHFTDAKLTVKKRD